MLNRRSFLASVAMAAMPTRLAFPQVENRYRMRMHWYVFGPAWEKEECRRQLQAMADAHIGGVLIFPTYPIAVDDLAHGIKNQRYLSDEFLETFNSVVHICHELGLTVDIVLGTGWPYGGPSVTLEDSAKSIKQRKLSLGSALPALAEGETRIAVIELNGEVHDYYSTPTRMQVKRASFGAEGLVIDHYNAAALRRYLQTVGDRLLGSVPKGGVRSIFCDSLEVYRATWTQALPELFQAKRGYDLRAHLPALFDGSMPDSKKVRYDFWRTLSEVAYEQFIVPLQEWAHQHGVKTQVEAYGTPPVSIASYRSVDVPTGEHYEWKEFSSSRWASSGGHLAGKNEIVAEAWTWAGMPNRFGDTLEQLKLCSDLHFLCGINALYGLTYAYSPMALGAPGWVPYFGPATNHTSPYWPYFSYLADYVNRASYVLQQGEPVAQIALYLPVEDCMAEAPPDQLLLNWAVRDRMSSNGAPPEFRLTNALHYESDVVKTIITNGFAFDGIDTFALRDLQIEKYAAVVLPNLTTIDLESIEKLAAFVRNGGTLIATKRLPDTGPKAKLLVNELFHSQRTGRGRAIFAEDETTSFRAALKTLPADIEFVEPSEYVSFVHRRTATRDWYFIVNTSEETQSLDAAFRVPRGRAPESWDLRTGQKRLRHTFEQVQTGVRLRFNLGPLESRVYVFTKDPRKPAVQSLLKRDHTPAPVVLDIPWSLRLDEHQFNLTTLTSWTTIPEVRYFSGRGVYQCQFDLTHLAGDFGIMLDLGQVRETADVTLNGRHVGVAWMRPYELDISGYVRPGRNTLRIDVTNLLINKILGMGPIDYSAVFAQYGNRFPPGDEWTAIREPVTSGLLGPVRLRYFKRVQ